MFDEGWGLVAVGDVGGIGDVDQVGVREVVADVMEDGESAYAGIEYADGG